MMDGSSVFSFRPEKRTPGTRAGSIQWSPLQALVLSSMTTALTMPVTPSQEAR
jgi:hypothetical protein